MLKYLIFFSCLIWNLYSSAQTCNNPDARLKKLRSPNISVDTISKWVKNDLELLNLQAGDTIADIGSYDGYYPNLYSILNDSLTFYLNDVQNDGFYYLDSIRTISETIVGHKISNEFIIILGNDTCTNLPMNTFNKVIVRDALHHFKSIEKMLADIRKTMKPESELILVEPISGQNINYAVCKGAMTENTLLDLMTNNGFILIKKIEGKKSLSWYKFSLNTNKK